MTPSFNPDDYDEIAVLVDLDGTLCDNTERNKLIHIDGNGIVTNWEQWHRACGMDTPVASVVRVLQLFHVAGYKIIALSFRLEQARVTTQTWLIKNDIPMDQMILNGEPEGSISPHDFKKKHLEELLTSRTLPALLIDDDPRNCLMAESLGIPSLNVSRELLGVDHV